MGRQEYPAWYNALDRDQRTALKQATSGGKRKRGKGWSGMARASGGMGKWRTKAGVAYLQSQWERPCPLDAEESELQARTEYTLKRFGWRWYHANVSILDEAGFLDLTCYRCFPGQARGTMLMLELKTERGEIRPEQEAWAKCWLEYGIPVYLVRPRNYLDLVHALRSGDTSRLATCALHLVRTPEPGRAEEPQERTEEEPSTNGKTPPPTRQPRKRVASSTQAPKSAPRDQREPGVTSNSTTASGTTTHKERGTRKSNKREKEVSL